MSRSNVPGGLDGSFGLAEAQRFVAAKGDTAMPFQLSPAPLLVGDFGVRLTHVSVRNGAVKFIVPLLSVWHHTAFLDGEGLVLRLAPSQLEIDDVLAPHIDDEFAIDLMFAPVDASDEDPAAAGAIKSAAAVPSMRLPFDDERIGASLFPG